MIIHITPSFYLKYSNISVQLIDVTVPELGIHLNAGKEITVRFPSPNKRLHFACRKKGRRAVFGILLETDRPVTDITVLARWAVEGDVSTHRVHMHFSGNEVAATDDIMLWRGVFTGGEDCSPPGTQGWIPADCQPRMSVTAGDRISQRETSIWRRIDGKGIIREQTEYYSAATIEPGRLLSAGGAKHRIPQQDDAFPCTVREYPQTLRVLHGFPGVSVCSLDEQLGLLDADLQAEGLQDAFRDLIAPVLAEIRPLCPMFFTNTSQLMNTIRRLSTRFSVLTDDQKQFVEHQINQPLFTVSAR